MRMRACAGRRPTAIRGPLLDRRSEREALDRLLADVRAGQSRVLVLRGEAGVGKTALLELRCRTRAAGCRVARAAGVESEMELAVRRPAPAVRADARPRSSALPGAAARRAARRVRPRAPAPPPDRFLVGLAVLEPARRGRRGAAAALPRRRRAVARPGVRAGARVRRAPAARRAGGARVRGARARRRARARRACRSCRSTGSATTTRARCWTPAIPGRLDERVRDRIVAETRGNPLALLELPRGLSAGRAGGRLRAARRDARWRAASSRASCGGSSRCPPTTRRLLLLAAAEPVGDATLLWRAAERLGIAAEAAAPAEAAGLIELGAQVRFRHPLVRSAAYRSASRAERRDGARGARRGDRPGARSRPARVAPRPGGRRRPTRRSPRSWSARPAARRRAAASPRRPRSSRRAADADARPGRARRAPARRGAGQAATPARSTPRSSCWPRPRRGPLDALQARAARAAARRRSRSTSAAARDAPPLLLEAPPGGSSRSTPRWRARPTSRRSARRCSPVASSAGPDVREAAAAARRAARGPARRRRSTSLLDAPRDAVHRGLRGGRAAAPARAGGRSRARGQHATTARWLWLTARGRRRRARAVGRRGLARARAPRRCGSRATPARSCLLQFALNYSRRSARCSPASSPPRRRVDRGGARDRARRPGTAPVGVRRAALAAWRGQEARRAELIERAAQDGDRARRWAAIGDCRDLRDGGALQRPRPLRRGARGRAAGVRARRPRALRPFVVPELAEAASRTGEPDARRGRARAAARSARRAARHRLGARDRGPRARAAERRRRRRALVPRVDRAARAHAALRVELARAHLLYGEWLRRERRRVGRARAAARRARDASAAMGADGVRRARPARAARDRRDGPQAHATTRATSSRRRRSRSRGSPRDGRTNPEIGAQLFISPRTVEWHLKKVFTKLGISSRRELRDALASQRDGAVVGSVDGPDRVTRARGVARTVAGPWPQRSIVSRARSGPSSRTSTSCTSRRGCGSCCWPAASSRG